MTGVKKLSAGLASLAGLAVTADGYQPLSKRGYLSMYAFSFGVFASELPLQLLASQVALLAAVTRKLPPRARRFSWLVSALSWLGLVGLHRIGAQADQPLKAALDAGLGLDRRTESGDLWKRPGGRVSPSHRECSVWRGSTAGTRTTPTSATANMAPGTTSTSGDGPTSIAAEGAGVAAGARRRMDGGSKRQQAYPLMSHLAELGWVCVAINYRLSPRSTWPDQIVDVKRALAWVKEHIAEYGGDPDWVAITGGSAGGHLSALAALTPNDPQFQPGFEDADTSVRAAVPFYGLYDFTRNDAIHPLMAPTLSKYVFKLRRPDILDAFRNASPITYVNPDAPPFFVLHGRNDSLIPVEQGRTFSKRLREVSRQPVAYAEMPFAQHAFDIFGSVRAAHATVAVEQFLAEIYSKRQVSV